MYKSVLSFDFKFYEVLFTIRNAESAVNTHSAGYPRLRISYAVVVNRSSAVTIYNAK